MPSPTAQTLVLDCANIEVTDGPLSSCLAGSRFFTEVLTQVWPFQRATLVPPKAQSVVPAALPPVRPCPEGTLDQPWPL